MNEDKAISAEQLEQIQDANGTFISLARWILDLIGIDKASDIVATLIMVILSTTISMLIYWIFKKLLLTVVRNLVIKTPTVWDDYVLSDKVLRRAAYLPCITSMVAFGLAMHTDNWLNTLYMKVVYLYMTFSIGRFLLAIIDSVFDLIVAQYPKVQSLKSIKQLVTYVVFILMFIIMVAIVIDKSPGTLIAGLGASAAIMSLVFKETIQSLVAGIQLSANNMVAVGDWIEVPKASANGVVVEMNLNTVKIRNWNNTITTVPPSTLLSDSFVNWRGMQQSAGRRINRSINIDMNTVRFVTDDELQQYRRVPELADYFRRRERGEESVQDQPTNLTLFREFFYAYLLKSRLIHDPKPEAQLFVRYLDVKEHGLPVEIYCFSKSKVWKDYETAIVMVVDHFLASLPFFGLRAYQVVANADAEHKQMSVNDIPAALFARKNSKRNAEVKEDSQSLNPTADSPQLPTDPSANKPAEAGQRNSRFFGRRYHKKSSGNEAANTTPEANTQPNANPQEKA